MNAAERVRAFLTARAETGDTVKHLNHISTSGTAELTETDLEVLLQMQDVLALLLSAVVQKTNAEPMPAEQFIEWAHTRIVGPPPAPENPHLPPGYAERLQEHEDRK